MYYSVVNSTAQREPDESEQELAPQPRQRRKRGPNPPWPPTKVWAAMNYVAQCQNALNPFKKEKSSSGICETEEYESTLEERDLHPAQIGSYRAACDLLTSYFNGVGWQQPVGLRTREAYEEFLGVLAERRKAAVE